MKNIYISLICILLLFLSCSKEDSNDNNNNNNNNNDFTIGDYYEGGIIFYLDLTGNHGYICDVKNLETSSNNGVTWGCDGTNISGADAIEIGFGFQNTNHIVAAGCGNAAMLCYNSNAQGYSDWYLPSYEELNKMYLNRYQIESANGVSPFGNDDFWSSSECGSDCAKSVDFVNGGDGYTYSPKDYYNKVRAIRSF